MAENETPQLITFRFPVTKQLMDDISTIVAEMNLEHDREMAALWARTSRYRRQRNMLAVTIGVIAWKSYRNYKAGWVKPLDKD
jgi:CHASE3 domain sensor protein